ncbi:MAG TPA: phosphatidylglycerophosphatase A [Pseudogracilibacillus sp.]|nr:phosphatidylglycerophosphatase A [Pseudogracilibacillus sp.]
MVEKQFEMQQKAKDLLKERGVEVKDIAELVYFLQTKYIEHLTMETCLHNVEKVLQKREVQHAVLTGIQLDIFAEKEKMMEPLQDIVHRDEGLYGIDEVLAFAIVNIYGSIGFTNYGYVDKVKPGILEKLNDPSSGEVHTFLDDIVGAVAAAAASRLAHSSAGDESLDN